MAKRGRPRKKRDIQLDLSPKQIQAYQVLEDKETRILFYGGAGGGGKTWLGGTWLFVNTQKYPNTRWGMARKQMTLAEDTMKGTFYKVLQWYSEKYKYNFENDYSFNAKNHVITHKNNGSEIRFVPLALEPQDPDYQHFGGKEFTGFFIDEIGESPIEGFYAMLTRLGRQYNKKYGLTPAKMFVASNPSHSWIYEYFYKPYRDGTLLDGIKFIPAYYYDNPFLDSTAVEQMESLAQISPSQYKRLALGLWEYEQDSSRLMNYDIILQLWENSYVPDGKRYITADIAREGRDETVIMLWSGWCLVKVYSMAKNKLDEAYNFIRDLQISNSIPSNHVCVDGDGLGAAIGDFGNYVGFISQKRPIVRSSTRENFTNVKAQSYFYIADLINRGKVYILPTACNESHKKKLISDLECVRRFKGEFDTKVGIEGKDLMRATLSRSPDYGDCVMMRGFLDLHIQHNNPYNIHGVYKI